MKFKDIPVGHKFIPDWMEDIESCSFVTKTSEIQCTCECGWFTDWGYFNSSLEVYPVIGYEDEIGA